MFSFPTTKGAITSRTDTQDTPGTDAMTPTMTKNKIYCLAAALGLYLFSGQAMAQQSCDAGTSPLNWNSPQGTTWDMCWSIDAKSGLTLTDVHFDSGSGRREVLGEASLAQLFIAYDDGSVATDYVTAKGLGSYLRPLTGDECFGNGAQTGVAGGINAMCHRDVDRGYLFRWYNNQAQGNLYEVFSISDIGKHTWIVRWRFYEDGTFEASLGSTGKLPKFSSASSYTEGVLGNNAVSWSSSAFWRLDFNIDGAANDTVREFKIAQTGTYKEKQTRTTKDIATETGRRIKRKFKHSWQILDTVTTNTEGHNISYHLEPQQGSIRYRSNAHAWSDWDMYVTRQRDCEKYVINNPSTGGCATNLASGFANGENTANDDIVLWFRISRHRWPRDEDMPFRSLEWDTFIVHPRDWDSLSPVTDATPAPAPMFNTPGHISYANVASLANPAAG